MKALLGRLFSAGRFDTSHSPCGSAAIARQRLLGDRAMRRHAAPSISASSGSATAPSLTATFPPPVLGEITLPSRDARRPHLSPADQRRQALHIARSFAGHYLTEIAYLPDQRLAVATIRPVPASHAYDVPRQISVDDAGNVDIDLLETGPPGQARHWRILRRVGLLIGSVFSALGAFYLAFAMIG